MKKSQRTISVKVLPGKIMTCSLIVMLTFLFSFSCYAAQLSFNPSQISLSMEAGEQHKIEYAVAAVDITGADLFCVFTLQLTEGEIDSSWISGDEIMLIDGAQGVLVGGSLELSVPADTLPGSYTAIFTPIVMESSEPIIEQPFIVKLEVAGKIGCDSPPFFTALEVEESVVRSKNDKPMTFSFSGAVEFSSDCVENTVSYDLVDEYGELTRNQIVDVDDNGHFDVDVTVKSSRKGTDKDGRTYKVVFKASNEVGSAPAVQHTITISHDNRKK